MTVPKGVNVPGIVTIGGILLLWQFFDATGVLSFSSVPSPVTIGGSLGDLVSSGAVFPPLLHTLWVVLIGAAIALAIGTALGFALGLSPVVNRWSLGSVDFLRTIPVVALLPVAILLWGPSTKSELIITAYAASWIMTINTAGAFRSVHPRMGDVASTFQLTSVDRIRKIWLPAVVPILLVGARLAVVSACLTAVIAETLVNPKGLGWEIIRAQQASNVNDLWAYALIAGWLGYLLNVVLVQGVRALSPGDRNSLSSIGA